jgi:hypothetical protein
VNARTVAHLTVIVLAALILPACAPLSAPPAPTTAPTALLVPTAAPPASGSALQPLDPESCAQLAKDMAKALDVEVTQGEVPFTDPVSGEAGIGCEAKATGTGEQFESPDAVVGAVAGMLEAQGWTEDPMLAAGGPTGTGSGFRKGNRVCLAGAIWHPDASANCPNDQPISACPVTPAQQLYTVTLDCAQTGA